MRLRIEIRQKSNTLGLCGFIIYKLLLELFIFTARQGRHWYTHFTDKLGLRDKYLLDAKVPR